ncbi:MAG: Uma2 family endonuclease, partial [Terriglobia bacterium]
MQRQSRRHYSLDEYFAVEETSGIRHEYFDGEIFAMAGSSVNHNHISANVLTSLRLVLRQSECSAFGSDLRVQTPRGLYTYPDVMVICGQIELTGGRPDTVMNPLILVEVLSGATWDYDRGEKFDLFKEIPSLREYVLVEQDSIFVEHHHRSGTDWAPKTLVSLDSSLHLPSI